MTINNCSISHNVASGAEYCYGGGIYNLGTMTITNSIVADNDAVTYSYYDYQDDPSEPPFVLTWVEGEGGGIFNDGPLTLIDSTISSNIAAISVAAASSTAAPATSTSPTARLPACNTFAGALTPPARPGEQWRPPPRAMAAASPILAPPA